MATQNSLEMLPTELIAHIATHTDALSAIRLSATCRFIRSACYNCLVFKDILACSQYRWGRHTLDLGIIDSIASKKKDVRVWARYALADQRAWVLAHRECPLEVPENFIRWLPELLAVKHPFMYHQCWSRYLRNGPKHNTRQIFCQAMGTLASSENMPQLAKSLQMQEDPILTEGDRTGTFLWAVCTLATTLRSCIKMRLAAWPYNESENVPYIEPPRAIQIPTESVHLPLPFSQPGSWEAWYENHNASLMSDVDFFTTGGPWCGYYTYFDPQSRYVDPPMVNVRFRVEPSTAASPEGLVLCADDCQDGVGTFRITGRLHRRKSDDGPGQVAVVAEKEYTNRNISWAWDLRLTPFGLVGVWGRRTNSDDAPRGAGRLGLVWLWKDEWTF